MTRTDWRKSHGLILAAFMMAAAFVPAFRVWPLFWLVPLLGYAAVVAAVPLLRSTFQVWRFGRVTRTSVAATAVIVVGSIAVLVSFQLLARPDLSSYTHVLPATTFGGVLAAGALFSVLNALCEEIVFRGILFDSIGVRWDPLMTVFATSLLFGYGHLHGYPPGVPGAVLAGIYGLCLGWLRLFSRGLGLPFLAHIVADATIFTLVARSGAA